MPVKAGYLLLAGGGGVVLWSGLKGKSVSSVFRQLAGGDAPQGASSANTIAGVLNTSAPASNTSGNVGTSMTGVPTSGYVGQVNSVSSAQAYAFSQFSKYGWGADQEQPLIDLWDQESGWNPNAVNPTSGAAGIAQSLGHGTVALGWANAESQINWGLSYIKQTYGSPAAAWAHEQAYDWY